MKKILLIALSLLLVGMTGVAMAVISGSVHDFSSDAWNPNGQICQPCHVPHSFSSSYEEGLLWNHDLSTTVYTLYSSNSLDGTIEQPLGVTKICLGCHDGTVGLDQFGGNDPFAPAGTQTAVVPNVAGDLNSVHPVSITYNDTDDLELEILESVSLGGVDLVDVVDSSERIHCSACHDVHNAAGEVADDPLLRVSLTDSALCLSCHLK
jgi:hypothetical protein